MPDRMSNRMSEDMSDRMPEDLPVRKCINVMVGITRSKVILIITIYIPLLYIIELFLTRDSSTIPLYIVVLYRKLL